MKVERNVIIKEISYTCDRCGKDNLDEKEIRVCEICDIDVCSDCDHADFAGSMYKYYCNSCWEFGESYRKNIKENNLKCEDEKTTIERSARKHEQDTITAWYADRLSNILESE